MRRLPLLDAVLIAIILPIWLAAATIHVWNVMQGRLAWVGVYVATPEGLGGYPRVEELWRNAEGTTSLAPDDTLLSVGPLSLAGRGAFGVFALSHEHRAAEASENSATPIVRVKYRRGNEEGSAVLPFFPVGLPWRMLPLTVSTMAAGVLVLISRPGVAVSRAFFLCAAAFSLHWTFFFGGDRRITYLWIATFACASTVMFPLILRAAWLLPERSVANEREPKWPWVFAVTGPVATTAFLGAPLPPALGFPGMFVLNVGFIVALLAVLTRNYLRADSLGRRQQKWVLYGLYAGLAPVFLIDLATLAVPEWWWLHELGTAAEMVIPVCIFIAIVRFKFYDIDRLITATVSYSALAVALLGFLFGVIPAAAEAASALVGVDRRVGTSVLSALVAVSLVFLYQSLNPLIARVLFRERFAMQQRVSDLLAEVSRSDARPALLEHAAMRLVEIFRPMSCVLYQRSQDEFLPLVLTSQAGMSAAPILRIDSPLLTALATSKGHLDVESFRSATQELSAGVDNRRALERVGAAIILPITVAGNVDSFIALGAKRSGDIYSPGDLALLGAVTDKIGGRLVQLDEGRRTAAGPILLPSKYEVLGEIGRGGMGHVYKVQHVALRKVVALKLLPPDLARDAQMVERFHREARIMATLNHPNIVSVSDVDERDGNHYFVMEYVVGQSLAQRVRQHGPLSLSDTLDVAVQVGRALMHAHAHDPPVIHRDIKPANILIDDASRRAIVTDFGIAKMVSPQQTIETQIGSIVGTLKYCPPEQLRGDRAIDGRADLYALGMVMFEILTGRHLLDGLTEHDLIRRVLEDATEYELGNELPPSVRAIIARAVAKSPGARYQSAGQMLDAIAAVSAEMHTDIPSPPSLYTSHMKPILTVESAAERHTETSGASPVDTLAPHASVMTMETTATVDGSMATTFRVVLAAVTVALLLLGGVLVIGLIRTH